ncbi:putative MFS-type transporter YhjX [Methylobacterium crusticola]|uniref:MFS-type transporter YhjX n=1 Tax=Methylobacterium crusticola TaxID=1697972 RepID=A0ABQ4QTI3_9HYPH|nr:MFS transporter [Methylobacterium crusticola]GJD48539.1 putative MFS-type transporter YhjX [Methylobacterium crusticola]
MPLPLPADGPDSAAAWRRLVVSVLLTTIGGVGMWSVVVVLPAVQAEFGAARGAAALPYTLTMVGFAFGGVLMGRLADRFGIVAPLVLGGLCLVLGYGATALAGSLWQFALAHGLLIGMLGSAAAFGPLMADISLWFERRRGIAVSLCASGNYLAGTLWPPLVQRAIEAYGWRATQAGIGLFCVATMLPLALLMRRRPPQAAGAAAAGRPGGAALGLSPGLLQGLLVLAGLACCVAMAMPQVHIVAYCGDLGYGVARGAEMLSLMLGFGIVSRVASGFLADRIGGLATLLAGSVLQGVALLLYLIFDGLTSLYVISALFGLFQGGIVPAYAIIVRELFPAHEAGARVGIVIMATLFGMALGGWLSGVIFDLAGSYSAAFANGLLWNLLNVSITLWLVQRFAARRSLAAA